MRCLSSGDGLDAGNAIQGEGIVARTQAFPLLCLHWSVNMDFVFGLPEAIMTALPIAIILGIIGPKWLRERRAKAQPAETPQD